MPLRIYDFDDGQLPHPNGRPLHLGFTPAGSSTGRFVAAVAENTWITGVNRTVLNSGLPVFGTPANVAITTAGGVATGGTTIIRVAGTNQFGEPVEERITVPASTASGTTIQGTKIFREVSSISVVSQSGSPSGTATLAIGHNSNTSTAWRVGLPFKLVDSAELYNVASSSPCYTQTGSTITTRAATIDLTNHCLVFTSISLNATDAVYVVPKLKRVGFRP